MSEDFGRGTREKNQIRDENCKGLATCTAYPSDDGFVNTLMSRSFTFLTSFLFRR